MNKSLIAISGLLALSLTGCSEGPQKKPEPTWEQASSNKLVLANYRAAEVLLAQVKSVLDPSQSMIVATVVNIDALDQSSTLGRLISEEVAGRFTQAGYRVIEMKFRNNVYVRQNQGELMLTREIKDLAKSHQAQAVVVGTYGQSDDYVFINLKVIQPSTNVVLAVHDYVLPLDASVRALARGR